MTKRNGIKILAICGCLLFSTIAQSVVAGSFKISFTNYNKTETLTNFPVMVMLSNNMSGTTFNFGSFLTTNGYDLRFLNSDSTSNLNYEIDTWNTNSGSYVWVQVPLFTNGCSIIANWGNSALTHQPSYSTNGSVWSDGFAGVWHMDSKTCRNSGGNRDFDVTDGWNTDNITTTNGVIGTCQHFVPYCGMLAGNVNLPTNGFSLSFWAYGDTDPEQQGGDQWNLVKPGSYGLWNQYDSWNLYINEWWWPGHVGFNSTRFTWIHVAGTYDGTTMNIYKDGVLASSSVSTGMTLSEDQLQCGANFCGNLDEIRAESVVRSSNWIWACYMNMASNSSFNTLGNFTTDASGSWGVDAGGAWSNANNWVGGIIASGNIATAYFTNALTASRTVTNNWNNMFLGRIVVGHTNFIITGSPIYYTNGSAQAIIQFDAGNPFGPTIRNGGSGYGTINMITGEGAQDVAAQFGGDWSGFHGVISNLMEGVGSSKATWNLTATTIFQPDVTIINGPSSTWYSTQGVYSNKWIVNGLGNSENFGSVRVENNNIYGTVTLNADAAIGAPLLSTRYWNIITNNGGSFSLSRLADTATRSNTVITLSSNIYVRLITNSCIGTLRFATITSCGSNATVNGTGWVPLYSTAGTITYDFTGTYTNAGLRVLNNSTLSISNACVQYLTNSLDGSGSHAFQVTAPATQVVSGVIYGAGRVIKTGNGLLNLTGANTYTGDTVISNGVVSWTISTAIPNNTPLVIANGATGDLAFVDAAYRRVSSLSLGGTNMPTGFYGKTNYPGYFTGVGLLGVNSDLITPSGWQTINGTNYLFVQ